MKTIDEQIAEFFVKEDKEKDQEIHDAWKNPQYANTLIYTASEVEDEADTV